MSSSDETSPQALQALAQVKRAPKRAPKRALKQPPKRAPKQPTKQSTKRAPKQSAKQSAKQPPKRTLAKQKALANAKTCPAGCGKLFKGKDPRLGVLRHLRHYATQWTSIDTSSGGMRRPLEMEYEDLEKHWKEHQTSK